MAFCSIAVGIDCHPRVTPRNINSNAASEVYGSVAVAVIRTDTIVVAAESRTTTDGIINPDTTCKITVVDSIVFAATGLLKGNSNALGIVDYARSVLNEPTKTWYKIHTFQSGASSLVMSWLNAPEYKDSLALSSFYRNGHSIQAMFCFFSGGKPVVVKYSFTPSLVGSRFKVGGVYDAGARKSGEILWIGAHEETDTLMKKDSAFFRRIYSLDAVSTAKSLIQRQMEFTPSIVGGDIDIVLITPTGAQWVQKKQNCF